MSPATLVLLNQRDYWSQARYQGLDRAAWYWRTTRAFISGDRSRIFMVKWMTWPILWGLRGIGGRWLLAHEISHSEGVEGDYWHPFDLMNRSGLLRWYTDDPQAQRLQEADRLLQETTIERRP